MQQCDAVVCTGEGFGMATLIEKVKDFKTVTGDFPMSMAAVVTLVIVWEIHS